MKAFDATPADLDQLLGTTAALLAERGQTRAAALLRETTLSLERDGGFFHPIEGDNWTANTYRGVLHIPGDSYAFDDHVRSAVWSVLEELLKRHDCLEVQELVFRDRLDPLPGVDPGWRSASDHSGTNQGRRSRNPSEDDRFTYRGLVFDSHAEITVFKMLERLQQELNQAATIAIAPLPAVKLRAVSTYIAPDVLVIGNGRAIIVEVDGPHHRSRRRRVDDDNRNRHWSRCGVRCIRVSVEDLSHAAAEVEKVLREDLARELGIPNPTPVDTDAG